MNGDSRLRPWEIRRLTRPGMSLPPDQHGEKPTPQASTVTHASHEAHLEYIQQRRSMSVKERLEEAIAEMKGQ